VIGQRLFGRLEKRARRRTRTTRARAIPYGERDVGRFDARMFGRAENDVAPDGWPLSDRGETELTRNARNY